MYTQCPECKAVFEIAATDLAVAGGFVRCGQCSKSFDALYSLSDRVPAESPPDTAMNRPAADSAPVVTEDPAVDKATDSPGAAEMPSAAEQYADEEADEITEKEPVRPPQVTATEPDQVPANTAATDHEPDVDAIPAAAGSAEPEAGGEAIPVADDSAETETDGAKIPVATDVAENETDGKTIPAAAGSAEPEAGGEAIPVSDDSEETETDGAKIPVATDVAENETDGETIPAAAGSADTETDGEEIRSATDSAAIAADDDEIVLDESYQPPAADDDEDFYAEDWLHAGDENETLASADKETANDAEEFFADEGNDNEYRDSPAVAEDEDAGTESAENAVDESALFTLPLPELTTLERNLHGNLPEKLEGGAAVHDPFAQGGPPPAFETAAIDRPVVQPAIQTTRATDAYDAEDARDLKDYLSAPVNRIATAAWATGAVLMALLLVGQIIHRNRGDLVIHPRLGPVVKSVYETLGADLRPNWQIGDYKVVGQARIIQMPPEETTTESAPSLRFVAIISNGADLPQPAPMVRLTLRDRWGDPTGVRDFTPPEYLADRSLIGRLLQPGQRLRVVLNLQDPGSDVVGFDFDMCLPDVAGTLRCAGEPLS